MDNETMEKLNELIATQHQLIRLHEAEVADLARQRDDLLAACKRMLLAHDAKAPSCGCGENGPCAWHDAYHMINRVCGDRYGDWYTAATGQGEVGA